MFKATHDCDVLKILHLHHPPFPLPIYKLFSIHHLSNGPAWLHTFFAFSDSSTCTPTFICHLFHTPPFPLIHPQCASLFPVLYSFPSSEESEYQTDYEEEAVESALSDMELYSRYGEHTEGEETVDTVRTSGHTGGHDEISSAKYSTLSAFCV